MSFLVGNKFKINQDVWVNGKTAPFEAKIYGYADNRVRLVTSKRKHLSRDEDHIYLTKETAEFAKNKKA